MKQLEDLNVLNKLVKSKEYETVNFDHENELIVNESIEFHCDNNLNTYEYY